jgi:hypothetical protein
VRAPGFGQGAGVLLARPFRQAQQLAQPHLHRQVSGGPDIGPPFGKQQVDFRRPAPHALDPHELRDGRLVIGGQRGQIEFARNHQFAQRAGIALLLPRQAAAAQRIEIGGEQVFGRHRLAQQRFQPRPDRSGRRHAHLLPHDGAQQRAIAGLANPRFGIAHFGQSRGERRVLHGKVIEPGPYRFCRKSHRAPHPFALANR